MKQLINIYLLLTVLVVEIISELLDPLNAGEAI
jgi:hypothetical protein